MESSFFYPSGSSSCIISILVIFCLVYGFHIDEAYSARGRTRVLYANSFTGSFRVFTFLFTNPSVLFAFPIMLLM